MKLQLPTFSAGRASGAGNVALNIASLGGQVGLLGGDEPAQVLEQHKGSMPSVEFQINKQIKANGTCRLFEAVEGCARVLRLANSNIFRAVTGRLSCVY